jgi:hypothetical protein
MLAAMTTTALHPKRLLPLLLVVAVLAALPAAADAAPARSGVYTGTAVHPPFSFAPDIEPYDTRFVVTVLRGRVVGMFVEARMECPNVTIMDKRFWSLKFRGPKLSGSGGFTLRKKGIVVSGTIGKRVASGTISASDGACDVSGVKWDAKKKRF